MLLASVRAVVESRGDWKADVVLLADGPLRPALEAAGATVHVEPVPASLAEFGDSGLRGGGGAPWLETLGRVARSPFLAVGYGRGLKKTLAVLEPDVVHSNGMKTHVLSRFVKPRRAALVWHVHDFLSERPLAKHLLQRCSGNVSGCIAISEAVKRDLANVLPGVATHAILNCVDTKHFSPGEADGAELDRLAGLPPVTNVVRVGLVAAYANWKGHMVFLEAIARVRNVRGYLVGGPVYATQRSQVTREEMVEAAHRLGITDRVGFIEQVSDTVPIYRMLDVAVHASTRPEPFGLTIVEAMSCGRALVASAAGGAAELVENERTALTHSPGDVDGLAGAIRRLACDAALRSRLGEEARRAVARFDQAVYFDSLVRFYRKFA